MRATVVNEGRVTIKDVAEHAGVTAQTVSRVMRNVGYVSQETRMRVLEVAQQLNYVPSYAAKALRNGMSRSIAIVFDSLVNLYFSVMIDHVRKAVTARGYALQLLFSNKSVITEDIYREAISHGAIGVISFLEGEEGIGDAVRNHNVPLMIFGRSTDDEAVDYVTTDDVQGGMLAAQRLIESGCTYFQYVVEGRGMTCAIDRNDGFTNALHIKGFPVEVIDINELGETGYDSLRMNDSSCGIFCFNDDLAFKVLKRMSDVPIQSRAKLIGYDNLQGDLSLPISLTSIGLDKQEHANFAVRKMEERIHNMSGRIAERCPVRIYEGDAVNII